MPPTAALSPADILRAASAVCFDVDSTVITEEGIDMLAAECGVGDEVAEWQVNGANAGITLQNN